MAKKYTQDEIINKFKEVHGNKYNYDKVVYEKMHSKVWIKCPIHGYFEQEVNSHLRGGNCPYCAIETIYLKNAKTTEQFIEEAKAVHGNKYDYSKVKYVNCKTKVCIICPEHGEFWQIPSGHIQGKGCKRCGRFNATQKQKLDINDFITKANKIHNNKYDYSKVEYNNIVTPVCIICPEHGEFWQKPYEHMSGRGCKKCGLISRTEKRKKNNEQFIKEAQSVHGDKYDYSKIVYINSYTPLYIICHEKDKYGNEHGGFWQIPINHLKGCGCSTCKQSHIENNIEILLQNNFDFIKQKSFIWLKNKSFLFLDFYLPDYNIAVECQGIQHFKPISFVKNKDIKTKEEFLKYNQLRDTKKFNLCKEHNIPILYYIPKKEWLENCELTIYNKENTFFSIEELINYIKRLNKTND